MSKDKLKYDIFEYLFEDSVEDLQDKKPLPIETESGDLDDELQLRESDFNALETDLDDMEFFEPHVHHHHDEDLDTQEYFEELDMDYPTEVGQDNLPVDDEDFDSFNIPLSGSPLQIKFNTGDSATPLQGQYPNSSYIDNNIPRAWLGILSYYG